MKTIINSISVICMNILCSCIPTSKSETYNDSKKIRETLLIVADLANQNKFEIISREHCCNSIAIIPSLDQDSISKLSHQNEKISYLKRYFSEYEIVISENNNIYISTPITELNKEINKKNHENLVLDKFTFRLCDIVFKKEKDKYLIYQIYSDFVPSHR